MSERIAIIGGDAKRHLYFANALVNNFNVVGSVVQERGKSIPKPEGYMDLSDASLWVRHFKTRDQKELEYFGEQTLPDVPLLKVTKETLNTNETAEFIKALEPDVVMVFGPAMIREPLASTLPDSTYNLHLGLSPRYRGAATLFWPQYFLEPNWAGTTLHKIVHTPDGGEIVHQSVPELRRSDGIHDVSCRAVIQATKDVVRILPNRSSWKLFTQKPEAGKNFLESDFQASHLRMIYHAFNDDIARAYLDGEIKSKSPKLRRQI